MRIPHAEVVKFHDATPGRCDGKRSDPSPQRGIPVGYAPRTAIVHNPPRKGTQCVPYRAAIHAERSHHE